MAYHDQYGGNQEFNPYSNSQPHASYEPPHTDNHGRFQDHSTGYQPKGSGPRSPDETSMHSGFDRGEFGTPRGEKVPTSGQYRKDFRDENLWKKGNRASCFGRYICCTIMIGVFMIVSIILALALWIRPPSIVIGSAGLTSGVQPSQTGIKLPLNANISVANPNYFAVQLNKVSIDLKYRVNDNDTHIGSGTKSNVNFPSHSNTSFTFPFEFDYEFASDPTFAIFLDIYKKCGTEGQQQGLTIDYDINVDVRILIATVSPTVSNSFKIDCPIDASTLSSLVQSLGIGTLFGSQ